MSGFISADGSALVGGRLPNGSGEAFNLDVNGNLLTNSSGPGSLSDGASAASLGEVAPGVYNSGGPVLASGVPSQASFDRLRSWLGKGTQTGTISATSTGDTSLTFSSAPKTILPGQPLRLGGAAQVEYVYVASSYVPSASATVIPLAQSVVNSGQISASWDIFNVYGPGAGSVGPAGTLLAVSVMLDVASGNLYAQQGFRGVTDVNAGGRTSLALAAATAGNTVVKASPGRLARILVTTGGSNALNIFDNASTPAGTQIALVPAGASAGTLIDCQAPALNGITVQGNAANPGVTIFYY